MSTDYCSCCGSKIVNDQKFCGGCGVSTESKADNSRVKPLNGCSSNDSILKDFLYDLTFAVKNYKGNEKFHLSDIPEKTLENASKFLGIPKDETIIALYDESVLCASGSRGVAFGFWGIYWRNDISKPSNISWADLVRCQNYIKKKFMAVSINVDDTIEIGQSGVSAKNFEKLLKECISIYKKYLDKGIDAQMPSWVAAWNDENKERNVKVDVSGEIRRKVKELRNSTKLKLEPDNGIFDSDLIGNHEQKPSRKESILDELWYIISGNLKCWVSSSRYGMDYSLLDEAKKKSITNSLYFTGSFLILILVLAVVNTNYSSSKPAPLPHNVSVENPVSFTGEWYYDVGSPKFFDARLIISNANGVYLLKRINGDGSIGVFTMSKVGEKLYKDGDKFGAYYVPTASGLKIYDSKSYIITASKVK